MFKYLGISLKFLGYLPSKVCFGQEALIIFKGFKPIKLG